MPHALASDPCHSAFRSNFFASSAFRALRGAGLFLSDAADPDPPSQLGFDVAPIQIAIAKEDDCVKDQVGDLLDEMRATDIAGLVTRLDDLGRLLDDLGSDLG